jgi:hypothetical protein
VIKEPGPGNAAQSGVEALADGDDLWPAALVVLTGQVLGGASATDACRGSRDDSRGLAVDIEPEAVVVGPGRHLRFFLAFCVRFRSGGSLGRYGFR